LGELSGNHFEVLLTNLPHDLSLCIERAQKIEAFIKKEGFPNYFGPQRFGEKGDNAERGKEVLKGKKVQSPWLKTFLLSAYQSELFNKWLSLRLDEGIFNQLCAGDACFKEGDSRPFLYKEEKDGGSTGSYTGPLFGKKMFWPTDQPLKKEEELWRGEGQTLEQLKDFPLYGDRRVGKVKVTDLKITPKEEGLLFEMTLPAGVFATSLLREFMKD
jgi:tRNA pseudouridine13 synthase